MSIMSDFDKLHNFLYELQLSMRREIEKLVLTTVENTSEVVECVGDWRRPITNEGMCKKGNGTIWSGKEWEIKQNRGPSLALESPE